MVSGNGFSTGMDDRVSFNWEEQQQQIHAGGFAEQLRVLAMFIGGMAATVASAVFLILPTKIHSAGLTTMLKNLCSSNPFLFEDAGKNGWIGSAGTSTKSAITTSFSKNAAASMSWQKGAMDRALSQVLELVNDIPASSRKYVFMRALADKLIQENAAHGAETLKQVNRTALKEGFARTIFQLSRYLGDIKQQQHVDALAWPWRLFKGIPIGVATTQLSAVPLVGNISSYLGYSRQSASSQQQLAAASRIVQIAEREEMAEKLANELSWMAEKLSECSALDDAIIQWSKAASLASLSLDAIPTVQRSMMKLSVVLCRGMACGDYEVSTDIISEFLLLWLPLLCTAISVIEGSIFSSFEKADAERMLEHAILLLSVSEQETVLAIWLREFSLSSSDWPNLQPCYYKWCHASRIQIPCIP